ncbi:MAG: nicotinamide-nucleotide amidohydrolase family protein [Verrucomicrobia bacterium]|nr:nicotinamide-nucleotide amidohydrolase family protein [Verrucomicrobiota bacterium]
MSIEIIAVGNEILRGMVVNTNAAYLSRRLTEEGWSVTGQTTLPDEMSLLTQGLDEALTRSTVVIATGGLGPTLDDNTAGCAQGLFSNAPQSIENTVGTAPGFLFAENKRVLFLLPGIPQEMEQMFEESVLPYLQKHLPPPKFFREALSFYLLRENDVDPLLRKLQAQYDIDMGIYPSYSCLSVVLRGRNSEHVAAAKKAIAEAFKSSLMPAAKLEEALHFWMKKHRKTLAFAESCTGGYMSSQITALAGASDYFLGSIVCYSNRLKQQLLHVSSETLQQHGAVSSETAQEMWKGLLQTTGADYGIAVTGIAGPTGGTDEKPVGTVWYALGARGENPEVGTFHLQGNRQTVIHRATRRLFAFLLKKIL